MQTKGQQQFDLSSGSMEPRTDPALASLHGQQVLPGLSQPASGLPKRTPGATSEQPHQLPMFMSQREIMHDYQPLDADRQEVWDPREGEVTNRKYTTMGNTNPKLRDADRNAPWIVRQGSAAAGATHYRNFGQTESLDAMMDRKLEESQMSYGEYADVHQGGDGSQATPQYEDLMERGSAPQYQGTGHTGTHEFDMDQYVEQKQSEHYERQNYGSLYGDIEEAMKPGGEGFTGLVHLATGQFGSAGKPQIGGAHHRLAALGEIAPDRLLPVVHHQKMGEARWGPSAKYFKYT